MTGLILLAHGSRNQAANEEVRILARALAVEGLSRRIDAAFLEAAEPDLVVAARDQAGSGCDRILVLPLFLTTGNHVRHDIPRLIEQARAACPETTIRQLDHLGAYAAQAELIGRIAKLAIESDEPGG